MRSRLFLTLVISASIALGPPAGAHHSFSAVFDRDRPIEVTGVITEVEWANPHVWFYIDIEGVNGDLVNWGFELGSVNALVRRGWNREDLQLGQTVTVSGVQAREEPFTGAVRSITLPNGQELFGGQPQ